MRNIQHKPKFYENSASSDIVVFIHGFMGSPRQFDSLAEAVHRQGYSAATLLLPGHGSTARDFGSGTFERWQSHVDAEIERYSCNFSNIWLTGHSMGGLLAINTAVRYNKYVRGILTIACPFKIIPLSAYTIQTRTRQVFRKTIRAAYLSNSSVGMSPTLIWHSRRPAAEIRKLMSAARGNLSQVRMPVTAVYSTSDELTSITSLDIMKRELTKAPFESVVLKESLHAYYTEYEQTMIEQALMNLVSIP